MLKSKSLALRGLHPVDLERLRSLGQRSLHLVVRYREKNSQNKIPF